MKNDTWLWTALFGLSLACCLIYLFYEPTGDPRAASVSTDQLLSADGLLADHRFAHSCVVVRLTASEQQSVRWAVANRCTQSVWLLPWSTPLDEAFGQQHWLVSALASCRQRSVTTCLAAEHSLAYRGPMAKRPAPQASDMRELLAGHELHVDVALGRYYGGEQADCYQVGWSAAVLVAAQQLLPDLPTIITAENCVQLMARAFN